MNDQRSYVIASGSTTFSLETMGFITFLVFLILKLTNVIDWSWFWIWFPLWIPIAAGLVLFVLYAIIVFILVVIIGRY